MEHLVAGVDWLLPGSMKDLQAITKACDRLLQFYAEENAGDSDLAGVVRALHVLAQGLLEQVKAHK